MAASPFQSRFHWQMDDMMPFVDAAFDSKDLSFVFEFDTKELVFAINSNEIEVRICINPRNDDADNVMAMVAFKSRGKEQSAWYADLSRRIDNSMVTDACFNYFEVAEHDSDSSWGVLAALDIILKRVVSMQHAVREFKNSAKLFYQGVTGEARVPMHLAQDIFALAYTGNVCSMAIQYYFDRSQSHVARALFA